MRRLFKNGTIINVFTDELEQHNVLVEDDKIIGVDNYSDEDADETVDITGLYLCPGFIDSHIHIESTLLTPPEFARAALPHGTTAVVADAHEIANVCGLTGLEYMIESSRGMPLDVYMAIPSCVPATPFDEAGAVLEAEDIEELFSDETVVALGEVMNYSGIIAGDEKLLKKINAALKHKLVINGHAPLLRGKPLDKYIRYRITDDHECSSLDEAMECIRKGQHTIIRQGTAAKNLEMLSGLFATPWSYRCTLSTDDLHCADLINNGDIDNIIRLSVKMGKNPMIGIRMATIQTAEYYGIRDRGAIAPGYFADMLVLEDLDNIKIKDVYKNGEKVVVNSTLIPFDSPSIDSIIEEKVKNSFHMPDVSASDFDIDESGIKSCRIIDLIKDQIITNELIDKIDFSQNNGIDVTRDILKIAVIERHHLTGHIGIGFIKGVGMKKGAIASSVSHDSHNLIVIGTSNEDMAFAANHVKEIKGGLVVVDNGKVLSEMPLPVAGLMTEISAEEAAKTNEAVRSSVNLLGISDGIEPFMHMGFTALPVIPHLRLTTKGLVNVDTQRLVPLVVE